MIPGRVTGAPDLVGKQASRSYAAIRNTDNPGRPGYYYDVVHPNGKVVGQSRRRG